LLPITPSETLQLVSALITTLGTAGAVYALVHLGSAFSVFPQARRLVTTGPYKFIRHPLYLFGELGLIGLAFAYAQPWAFLLAALSFFAQFPRMFYEEKLLTTAFDEYATYAARTPRLIPGIY
jgi:protein-S-isoprenylcysteine O-methyltransferase Ste14